MQVRPYTENDFEACMAVFESNLDPYFQESERAEFAAYLKQHGSDYLVMEEADRLVACGGYAFDGTTGVFCWGMVARDHHRRGLGKQLSLARIEYLCKRPDVVQLKLNTSQHTTGFYERLGFRQIKVIKDGYGPGLDCCDMVLSVADLPAQS